MKSKSVWRCLAGMMMLAASGSANAIFHLWQISEIYSNADGTLQFIEFFTSFDSQQFVMGQQVQISNGASTNVFTIPTNLQGSSTNRRFLIGTAGIQAAGGPAPDFIMPDNFLFKTNGSITFFGANSGPYGDLPIDGSLSKAMGVNGAAATNSPTNYAGATGTVAPPAMPPGAPQNVVATAGNSQASISFSPPANNGGATITSYSVACTPGPLTQSGPGSPLVVMGLSNGTLYSCAVRATNSAGQGAASNAVNVTPFGPPDPPTNVSATAGNGGVSVAFTPPANNGGAAVAFYTATCSAGAPTTGAASPITVSGLTAGVAVTCSVIAHNAAGVSVPSASAMATPFGPPSVPLNFMVTPQDSSVMVTFSPPANDGGSMIDNYTVFCTSPGGGKLNSGLSSPIIVGGMTNGVAYACSMRARNAAGLFSPSTAEIVVTPATIPGAPTLSTLVRGDGRVQVNFAPPANDGGSPILSFGVKCNNGGGDVVVNVAQSPALVTGLTNLSSYACRVSATNAVGTGPDSTSSNIVPDASVAPRLLAAVYRKLHGVAGERDIPINIDTDVEGNPTVESRNAGTGHRVVMNFNVPITSIGVVTLTDPMVVELCCANPSYNGFDTTLTITGLPAVQRLTVLVDALNGAGTGTTFPIAFMPGDVTSSRRVNAADISAVKARGGPVTSANARFDINLDGTISSSDTSIVKSKSGTIVP